MQVLCKSTSRNAEANCAVCGQGFVMFWERQSPAERSAAISEIQKTLRKQHRNRKGPEAHPPGGFLVPEWDGRLSRSAAAILGNAPSWSL